jgi:hypothetical protein
MRRQRIQRVLVRLADWSRRAVPSPRSSVARVERRRERVRVAFGNARDRFRAAVEDVVEVETRALCPRATGLEVEIYVDELGGPRARLVSVNADEAVPDEQEEIVRQVIGGPPDEWAVAADPDTVEIFFRALPTAALAAS